MKKKLTLVVALVLILAISVGGTLAYLTYTTDAVTNTFTVGNVKITLSETDADNDKNLLANSYKMIPGSDIAKDPKVTVLEGSEACYVFVKLEKSGEATLKDGSKKGFDDFISSSIATDWTALTGVDGVDGVYYIVQAAVADDNNEETVGTVYSVLASDKVTVNAGVTQEMMDALGETGAVQPQLKITAYAIQQANMKDAADAWTKLNAQINPPAEGEGA